MREAIRPVAEGGHHEELLQRRIHVAGGALVDDARVLSTHLGRWRDRPFRAPVGRMDRIERIEHREQVRQAAAR